MGLMGWERPAEQRSKGQRHPPPQAAPHMETNNAPLKRCVPAVWAPEPPPEPPAAAARTPSRPGATHLSRNSRSMNVTIPKVAR